MDSYRLKSQTIFHTKETTTAHFLQLVCIKIYLAQMNSLCQISQDCLSDKISVIFQIHNTQKIHKVYIAFNKGNCDFRSSHTPCLALNPMQVSQL